MIGAAKAVSSSWLFRKFFDPQGHGQPQFAMFVGFEVDAIHWAGPDDSRGVKKGTSQFLGSTMKVDSKLV